MKTAITILDEIALKCGDEKYQDFDKTVYLNVLYRVINSLNKKNNILIYQHKKRYAINDKSFPLDIKSVYEIVDIRIEGKQYILTPLIDNLGEYQYHKQVVNNRYFISVALPEGEYEVEVLYSGIVDIEDIEDRNDIPIIPRKYEEQIIERCVIEIARIGIATHLDQAHQLKYTNILKTYQDVNIEKENRGWITIKVWDIWGDNGII